MRVVLFCIIGILGINDVTGFVNKNSHECSWEVELIGHNSNDIRNFKYKKGQNRYGQLKDNGCGTWIIVRIVIDNNGKREEKIV